MNTLKLPTWEDEYDAALAKRSTETLIPATPLWTRRLGGPADTWPTEVTFYRGLFGSGKPRRCVTAAVTGIELEVKPGQGGGFGAFHIKHAALDAADEKTEEIQ